VKVRGGSERHGDGLASEILWRGDRLVDDQCFRIVDIVVDVDDLKVDTPAEAGADGEEPLSEMSIEPEAMALMTSVPDVNFTNSTLLPARPSFLIRSIWVFHGV
jgi:hypothetical protein